jgi:hypothetical protein
MKFRVVFKHLPPKKAPPDLVCRSIVEMVDKTIAVLLKERSTTYTIDQLWQWQWRHALVEEKLMELVLELKKYRLTHSL